MKPGKRKKYISEIKALTDQIRVLELQSEQNRIMAFRYKDKYEAVMGLFKIMFQKT